ncbi:MAG: phage integrase SAM-like domain-containing protein [Chitinophagaceae bacterium]
MKIKFYLLRKQNKIATGLICSVSYNKNRIRFCINESINPKYWNLKTCRARHTPAFSEAMEFNYKLDSIVSKINKQYLNCFNKDGIIPSKPLLENFIKTEILNEKKRFSFYDFYEEFINSTTSGCRLNSKGKVIKPEAAKYYKRALRILKEYKSHLEFEDITLEFYKDFVAHLNKKGFSLNTVGDNIKKLKAVMAASLELGYHKNTAFKGKYFTKPAEEADNIYLSLTELNLIHSLDLSDKRTLENVRDLFLIGCYTGLRFSDFSKLAQQNIADGYITIQQTKTGEDVIIPVHNVIKKIIKKHDGLPAIVSNQKFNIYLKDICKTIPAFLEVVPKVITKAGKKVTLNLRKWEMISSHTARRSFATNEYLNGTPSITIMAVTGHKTEKAFLKYIKVTSREHAEKMNILWEKRELKLVAV